MAHLRTTIVTHEHTPIETGKGNLTIGQLIDKQLLEFARQGKLFSEVSFFIEEEAEQLDVQRIYLELEIIDEKKQKAKY